VVRANYSISGAHLAVLKVPFLVQLFVHQLHHTFILSRTRPRSVQLPVPNVISTLEISDGLLHTRTISYKLSTLDVVGTIDYNFDRLLKQPPYARKVTSPDLKIEFTLC
jgi:hypothetical protein